MKPSATKTLELPHPEPRIIDKNTIVKDQSPRWYDGSLGLFFMAPDMLALVIAQKQGARFLEAC